MTGLITREWVLSAAGPISIGMIIIFLVNLWGRVRDFGLGWGWYRSEWNRAIVGLIAFKVGTGLRVWWVWALLREYERSGGATRLVEKWWWVDALGGVLTVIGGLCVIREFSPRGWGWVWVVVGVLTGMWMGLVHWR